VGYILLWSYPQIKYQRDQAIRFRKEADLQRKVAEDRYTHIIRLSDTQRLSELERDAERLWPAHPGRVDELNGWLDRAEELLGRCETHRQWLAVLRKDALLYEEQEPDVSETRTWRFADPETRWQHDMLVALISGLEALTDEKAGLFKSIEDRLSFATTIEKRSIQDYEDIWEEAVASISDREESPQYNGLVIRPYMGIIPLGSDPDSGLWEFAHLQTGEPPERGPDGKLDLIEKTGLVFVLIPGGTFDMGSIRPSEDQPIGSPNVNPNAESDEAPVHAVSLNPFFLSKFEMTQAQWTCFTGENPSLYGPEFKFGDKQHNLLHPVEQVSWNECVHLLSRLGLRFPSEAEWEYAARAGTATVWWTGNEKETIKGAANICDLYCMDNGGLTDMKYEKWLDDGYTAHAPVGSYLPNAFGLHDTMGNVYEWCRDSYGVNYNEVPLDGSAFEIKSALLRIGRGGGYNVTAGICGSANRSGLDPTGRMPGLGLRPAFSLPSSDP